MLILIILAIIFVIICAFVSSFIKNYNDLVKYRSKVKNAWAQIDAQLQRKFDLIPNLVESVKGSVAHEKHILENTASLIDKYKNTENDKEKFAMDSELNSCLHSLYTIAETNPNLRANMSFLRLQEELSEIEEDISFARQFYNDAVTIYNRKIQCFPGNIIAAKFNFKEEELFDAFKNEDKILRIHFKYQCPVCGANITENSTVCSFCGTAL